MPNEISEFDTLVAQLMGFGYSRPEAEKAVREQHPHLAPTPAAIERDARVLEKAEQLEIRKLALAYGFKVKNLSQYRPAKVSLGFPDLKLIHKQLPLMCWWETKRQVGGTLSPAQEEFRDDCIRCNERHGYGDRYAFVEKLIELEVAVRGAGQYGIEPVRLAAHLDTPKSAAG
jgi:hypothetical protein